MRNALHAALVECFNALLSFSLNESFSRINFSSDGVNFIYERAFLGLFTFMAFD
jgi:hypothetical protein